MTLIAYVDGRYVEASEAVVSIEDRGFQFGDAVYEVWFYRDGVLFDAEGHLQRLYRSLASLQIDCPLNERALLLVLKRTARRNRLREGIVYLQISRGKAPRVHGFPKPGVRPTVVITASHSSLASKEQLAGKGVAVVTLPDERWGRCDIKSVNLLPNVLAKQSAYDAGAFEAWLVDQKGLITEGTSTTAWIVDASNRLRTRPLDQHILPGVTRASLMRIIAAEGMAISEEPFSPEEAREAKEAFLTSATSQVMPVVSIDGSPIGSGEPGALTQRLRKAWIAGQ